MVAGRAVFKGRGCGILQHLGQGVGMALASHFGSPYSMPMERQRCPSPDGSNGPADSACRGISRAKFFGNKRCPPSFRIGLIPVQGLASGWGLGGDSAS